MERPLCQETRLKDGEPCKNPAKFIVDAPAYKGYLVCGTHARIFLAKALHPFRFNNWKREG